ncbi:hypothetical protein OBBRIDRAFT_646978 [Obba rivulosa]|uniref:Uncharacterized protein n=1 Tax=Obba rivulosa TaxID=1052685 RepID=A0A8E2DSV0_9APHY|nr:hypothetical protein OBBRIDRAFT_646978 [Obba rivulosa]
MSCGAGERSRDGFARLSHHTPIGRKFHSLPTLYQPNGHLMESRVRLGCVCTFTAFHLICWLNGTLGAKVPALLRQRASDSTSGDCSTASAVGHPVKSQMLQAIGSCFPLVQAWVNYQRFLGQILTEESLCSLLPATHPRSQLVSRTVSVRPWPTCGSRVHQGRCRQPVHGPSDRVLALPL